MKITKVTEIEINPSDKRDYRWWIDSKENLLKENYWLEEKDTLR